MTSAGDGKTSLLETLYQIAPHDHLCLIYESEEEQLQALLPYLQFGLEQGEQCLYFGSPDSLAAILLAMNELGIAVESATASGAICLVGEADLMAEKGKIDPESIIALLRDRAKSASKRGFSGVRAALDMSWVLSNANHIEQLIRCEAKLATSIHNSIASALCQYRRDMLDEDMLKGALLTHPKVILGRSAHDNRSYLPPQRVITCDPSQISLRDLLGDILPAAQADAILQADSAAMRTTDRVFKKWAGGDSTAVGTNRISPASLPQELVERGPVPIFELDAELTVTAANEAFLHQIRLPPEAVFGKNIENLIPAFPTGSFREALRTGVPLQMGSRTVDLPHDPEHGESYWDLAIWPAPAGAPATVKLVVIAWEVTDHVKLRQQREDFMSILAHNLNPPLLGDHRALEILLSGVLGEMQPRQAEVVSLLRKSNVGQMKMVQDLLEVFRYETGTKDLLFKELKLGSILKACIAEVNPLAQRIELEIRPAFTDDLPPIEADGLSLQRLFVNLLGNAIKFSPTGGIIDVEAEQIDGEVIVRVTDRGTGVPPQDEPKLFERFWHGGSPGALYPPRTGVGLFLCRKIVEAHQGQIRYSRQPDGGSTFSVTLPVKHNA